MHEYALAEGVIAAALEVAAEGGVKQVTRVAVVVGELQQIERELFAQVLLEMTPAAYAELADAVFDLRIEPALFQCRSCRREFGLEDASAGLAEDQAEAIHFVPELAHTYLRCPDCGSPDFEIKAGRGVWLAAVEGNA